MSTRPTSEEARNRAEQRFQKITERERAAEQAVKDQEKEYKATADKVERLRAMRLAKEAAQSGGEPSELEREAELQAEEQRAAILAIGKPPAPPKPKRATRKKAAVQH